MRRAGEVVCLPRPQGFFLQGKLSENVRLTGITVQQIALAEALIHGEAAGEHIGSIFQEALALHASVAGVVAREFGDGETRLGQVKRGVYGCGRRIVVRMASLVGVGEDERRAERVKKCGQARRMLGDAKYGLLVRAFQTDGGAARQPGGGQSPFEFAAT